MHTLYIREIADPDATPKFELSSSAKRLAVDGLLTGANVELIGTTPGRKKDIATPQVRSAQDTRMCPEMVEVTVLAMLPNATVRRDVATVLVR